MLSAPPPLTATATDWAHPSFQDLSYGEHNRKPLVFLRRTSLRFFALFTYRLVRSSRKEAPC